MDHVIAADVSWCSGGIPNQIRQGMSATLSGLCKYERRGGGQKNRLHAFKALGGSLRAPYRSLWADIRCIVSRPSESSFPFVGILRLHCHKFWIMVRRR